MESVKRLGRGVEQMGSLVNGRVTHLGRGLLPSSGRSAATPSDASCSAAPRPSSEAVPPRMLSNFSGANQRAFMLGGAALPTAAYLMNVASTQLACLPPAGLSAPGWRHGPGTGLVAGATLAGVAHVSATQWGLQLDGRQALASMEFLTTCAGPVLLRLAQWDRDAARNVVLEQGLYYLVEVGSVNVLVTGVLRAASTTACRAAAAASVGASLGYLSSRAEAGSVGDFLSRSVGCLLGVAWLLSLCDRLQRCRLWYRDHSTNGEVC